MPEQQLGAICGRLELPDQQHLTSLLAFRLRKIQYAGSSQFPTPMKPLGNKAKAYQVKQVRNMILKYQPETD